MRKTVIVGNWKMNKNFSDTKAFLGQLENVFEQNKNKIIDNLDFGIAAPFPNLAAFKESKVEGLKLAAQDMSQFDKGAYTGDTSADMLLDLNVKYVVLGHSERRAYHFETDEVVNAKAAKAIEKGLTPIVCVGETLEQYEQGKTKEVVKEQVEKSLKCLDLSKLVIAYEPIWAIGTGKVATPEVAEDVCKYIRSITADHAIIQYGGSVSPKNVAELHSMPNIDGFLVGGASLEADSFVQLLTLGK